MQSICPATEYFVVPRIYSFVKFFRRSRRDSGSVFADCNGFQTNLCINLFTFSGELNWQSLITLSKTSIHFFVIAFSATAPLRHSFFPYLSLSSLFSFGEHISRKPVEKMEWVDYQNGLIPSSILNHSASDSPKKIVLYPVCKVVADAECNVLITLLMNWVLCKMFGAPCADTGSKIWI